ncbi:MarR family winged helix-turn-helix transcriptional regulator [Porphyromonas gingivicanis]|uniref:MarR family winged helix-turn-helix transcriptional regulator n=1 Tax=Porphyromonas gingivicanis TaxID=266762 RepID=UPI00046E8B53|nr:MarR family transcriptional regulator [Porphyromonas gingivicanis]
MRPYELLEKLLPEINAFEELYAERESCSMEDFAAFLSERAKTERHTEDLPFTVNARGSSIEAIIAQDLSFLFRYMRGYFKKALRGSALLTMEEYTYLVCLLYYPMMTKTELNNINVMEKTSGTEVINRLLKNGLISQRVNETDRRSFYVSITDKGREELTHLFPQLQLAVKVLFHPLTEAQKSVLHSIHHTLEKHNRMLFMEYHDEPLPELYALLPKQ